ncbi:thioredoxin reductase [Basidiobolus meristosporus CBS 931.73]|uniref:Thioredoxin reductase n=1 Tax=Basidiobolus meristosporus CBS 931.73 TaxID=1314790 RepID=A0A1Y1YVW7_9FUNG|nr:thioredoxin reductase [Basidiobolus meristosporus CBS 931.73]|eukprot:ORY01867.1 thioredoxin reductase [Basidiobolus meristosporus CBS 931.73]
MHASVIIIGSGPAGHTAGIYTARANLSPVMFEGMLAGGVAPGGQLTTTTEIENFPGFPGVITGPELMDNIRKQSEKFGTEIITETITRVDFSARPFKVWREGADSANDEPDTADAIIIATGATAKRLFIPGEDVYWQNGISACAVCDGAVPIFRNKPLAVVGGGDSAVEEAIFLTKYASKVYVLVRRDKLRASTIMANRLMKHPKVEILWNTAPMEAKGDGSLLRSLTLQDTKTLETRDLEVNGLFYAIGHKPNTDAFKGIVDLDSDGYIKVVPGTTHTNIEGVFAAGDVQDRRYRQAITAAGSGCQAALDTIQFLESQEE